MSYIRPLETDSLPLLNDSASARRIRSLEEELAAFRRGNTPRYGYLKYGEFENGGGNITRRAVTELQEQVRVFREELRKKDAMIQHLVSLESAPRVQQSTEKFEVLYQGDKEALERARSDVAALQVRNERLTQQVKESDAETEANKVKVKELETLLESKRENEGRLAEVIQSLRERISELEGKLGSYETVSNRGEYTVNTLQKDLRESSDKIVELETRIRELTEEQHSWELKVKEAEQKFQDLTAQLGSLLHVSEESWDSTISVETIVRKVSDVLEDAAVLKGKLQSQTEALTSVQVESKASRETIMRLVSEMGREQKAAQQCTAELHRVTAERDGAQVAVSELQRDLDLLRERLQSSERLHEATKAELMQRDQRLTKLEVEIRQSCSTVQVTSTSYESFRDQLASILSTVFEDLEVSEDGVKEAIRRLVVDIREYRLKAEEAEGRLVSVSSHLEKELSSHEALTLKLKQYQTENSDLDSKLRTAEGELAAGDVLREGFKADKEKYLKGLQTLGEVLKMDQTSLDLGLDMTLEALTARAQQLISLECDTIAERTSQMYTMKRRTKALKDQLESKELHIDLLRKKLTALEEKVHGRLDMQKLAEAESLQVKKLESQVARYRLKLTDARQEIQNLKAQLLGTTELKLATLEQREAMVALGSQVEELQGERRQQADRISTMKREASTTQSQLQDRLLVADNAVTALSSELRTTKTALDDCTYREKKLLDFRSVVCRMLGLQMSSLAVPDYDIIRRLELLIQAHHSSAVTTLGLQKALADAEDGLLTDMDIVDPLVRHSRLRCRRRAARARARSLSPVLIN